MARSSSAQQQDPVRVLLALPADHPYRAAADGTYRWKHASDSTAWETARALLVEVLAANAGLPGHTDRTSASGRRSAAAGYLYWLSSVQPDILRVPDALGDLPLLRYVATDGSQRRSSHRSRTAVVSQVRSFRQAYASSFPRLPRLPGADDDDPQQPPLDDWEWEAAWDLTRGFANPTTRRHARAVLLLGRSAGLNGGDMQWVTGDCVHRIPSAGTWVTVPDGAARPGRVPVLTRFADRLLDLADGREGVTLVSRTDAPCDASAVHSITGQINRKVAAHRHRFTVSAERLRRAWIIEHVASNTPANTLMKAARVKSWRTFEELVTVHGPRPPDEPAHLAWELGGVGRDPHTATDEYEDGGEHQ